MSCHKSARVVDHHLGLTQNSDNLSELRSVLFGRNVPILLRRTFLHLKKPVPLSKTTRRKYSSYLVTLASDVATNPKRFWSFVKARTKQHSLPSVLQHDASGLRAADPSNKASMLMDYFQTVYACPDDEPESVLPQVLPSDLYTMPAIEIETRYGVNLEILTFLRLADLIICQVSS